MRKSFHYLNLIILLLLFSCTKNKDLVVYHTFKNRIWERFDFIHFDIPVTLREGNYDVYLFVHHTSEYEFDDLSFQMGMNTPTGEERVKEYNIRIRRKDGGFAGQCSKDSCEVLVPLKKELKLSPGNLHIELENLVPRLKTRGVLSIGIRITPSI